ncbi:hypothetical protein [Capsulimonas corticalis]|uniref:hypothetical protein n=1 Tax=Capsulimonas corticalis TaxID=2219043 RepID=UPI000F6461A8|nr:hypothetical protein [Capsulimonas corticalis]
MDIRVGIDGCSPHQRADRVRRRLSPILGIADLRPSDVVVRRSRHGRDVSISVHRHLLVIVDNALARANGMKPRVLAAHWAATLSVVLPQVCVQGRRRGD